MGERERKITSDGEVLGRIRDLGGIDYSLELQGKEHVSLIR